MKLKALSGSDTRPRGSMLNPTIKGASYRALRDHGLLRIVAIPDPNARRLLPECGSGKTLALARAMLEHAFVPRTYAAHRVCSVRHARAPHRHCRSKSR